MSIHLGKSVVVSDPTGDILFFLGVVLRNVLPGDYNVFVEQTNLGRFWGRRNTILLLVHHKHSKKPLVWKKYRHEVGVDSGQAGVFDKKSYKDDMSVSHIPWIKKKAPWKFNENNPGELWDTKMSDMTLNSKSGWGCYGSGVVSSSGLGDGNYPIYIARDEEKKIIGIAIVFHTKDDKPNLDFYLS